MVNRKDATILLISKDTKLKTFFRNLFQSKKFSKINLVICNKVTKKQENYHIPKGCNIRIIFIDIDRLDLPEMQSTLKFFQRNYIAVPIFLISTKKDEITNPIECLFNYGSFIVLRKPLTKACIKSILYKHLNYLRDQSFDFQKYNNLILNKRFQYAIFNNCKIFLSERECLLLSILMREESILSCRAIKECTEERIGQSISEASIRVCIRRIRKKFREATGMSLIENKYGRGYYINI
jgi:DNA-binding response OmpR family regulator